MSLLGGPRRMRRGPLVCITKGTGSTVTCHIGVQMPHVILARNTAPARAARGGIFRMSRDREPLMNLTSPVGGKFAGRAP